jgi:hypothetical protein
MNVHVHIERLVLEDLPLTRADSSLVQAALERELTRLVVDHGLPTGLVSGQAVRRRVGGDLAVSPGATPGDVGVGIAQSIHGGLSGGGPP